MSSSDLHSLDEVFCGSWLAASNLCQLQLALRDPERLGARFFWQEIPQYDVLCDKAGADLLPGERWLYVEWAGEVPRPMSEAEERKIVRRLHQLGFKQVTVKRLWGVLAPTLPHDGYGKRGRR